MKETFIKKEVKKALIKSKAEIIKKAIVSIILRSTVFIVPIFWGKAIDSISKGNMEQGYKLLILSILVVIIYYFTEIINNKIYYNVHNKIYNYLHDLAAKALTENSMYSLSRFSASEYINIIDNDVSVIAKYYTNLIIRVVRLAEFLLIFIYFWFLNFYIFLFTMFLSAAMFLVLKSFGKKILEYNLMQKQSLDEKDVLVYEVFNGIKEIKGFNVSSSIRKRIKYSCDEYIGKFTKYNKFAFSAKIFILFIIDFSKYMLALYGFYLFSKNQMELGTILIIFSYYSNMLSNFDNLVATSIDSRDLNVSMKRFDKLLEFRVVDYNKSYKKKINYNGKITFDSVLYGNKEDPILDNASFVIKPNTITIITGKPGTGKTGIFDLLLKLNRKHSGNIIIDSTQIEKIDESIYYRLISSGVKDPSFFNLTIKENLTLIDDDFEEVVEVCKLLGIDKEINNLPEGYDTMILEGSMKITSNLRQLIAIARVLIRDSKIMLFDESVSMLEKDSQQRVLKIFQKLKKDHTIVIISREENIMKIADEIIVMGSNTVKEVGSHKELINNNGCYFDLYGEGAEDNIE